MPSRNSDASLALGRGSTCQDARSCLSLSSMPSFVCSPMRSSIADARTPLVKLAFDSGQVRLARRLGDELLGLFSEASDPWAHAMARVYQAQGELDAGDTEAGRRHLEVALPITARFAFHYLGSMAARLIVRSDPAGDGMSGPGVSPAPARCGISSHSVWCLRGPVMSGHQRTALTGHGRAGHSLDGRGRGYEH